MAEDTKKQQLPLKEEIVQKARDKVVNAFAKRAGERVQGGENPEDVLKSLVSTLSPQKKTQVQQLAQEQVPVPGSQIGLPASVGRLFKGQLSSPFSPRTQPRGEKEALSLLKTLTTLQSPQEAGKQTVVTAQEKEAQKASTSFNKVVGLSSGLVAQFKAKLIQQGGVGGIGPGVGGLVRRKLKDPSATAIESFVGQRRETVFALNSIITGQNRVIKGVIEFIGQTLPTEFDPPGFMANKMAQTLTNSFKLANSFKKFKFTDVQLDSLTSEQVRVMAEGTSLSPQEEQFINGVIKEVLATPATEQRRLPGFETPEKGAATAKRARQKGAFKVRQIA